MEPIPGRTPASAKARDSWAEIGARTRLAAVRIIKGVRQEDLAGAVGVSTASLRRVESGASGPGVSVGVLLACAAALDVPFTALIEDHWLEVAEQTQPPPRHIVPSRSYRPLPDA